MMRNSVKVKALGSVCFSLPSHPPHQIKIPASKDREREEQESFRNWSVSEPCLLPQY